MVTAHPSTGQAMNRRRLGLFVAAGALLAAVNTRAEEPPTTWDGLVRVRSKKLKFVYLAPGADFRAYTQVMIDPTEVAFDKQWLDNYNENASFGTRLTGSDVTQAVTEGVKRASGEFDKAFADAGYPVVTTPGADVLRVRTAILNVEVASPDVSIGQGRTFSTSGAAGAATFVVEVRDSQSGALLGRAVDSRLAGNNGMLLRNTLTNWADFEELIKTWAKISVAGLNELKTLSPVPAGAAIPG
jgi:Protein of unknown function (DUF3313)